VDGSKNVFRAALHARVPAVVYASSVAAYGVFKDHPRPIVEEKSSGGTWARSCRPR